jgi:hypothetical protein
MDKNGKNPLDQPGHSRDAHLKSCRSKFPFRRPETFLKNSQSSLPHCQNRPSSFGKNSSTRLLNLDRSATNSLSATSSEFWDGDETNEVGVSDSLPPQRRGFLHRGKEGKARSSGPLGVGRSPILREQALLHRIWAFAPFFAVLDRVSPRWEGARPCSGS